MTAHAEANAKFAELYFAINDLMAHLGAYGCIDPAGPLSDRVMDALYDIDGGQVLESGELMWRMIP